MWGNADRFGKGERSQYTSRLLTSMTSWLMLLLLVCYNTAVIIDSRQWNNLLSVCYCNCNATFSPSFVFCSDFPTAKKKNNSEAYSDAISSSIFFFTVSNAIQVKQLVQNG